MRRLALQVYKDEIEKMYVLLHFQIGDFAMLMCTTDTKSLKVTRRPGRRA